MRLLRRYTPPFAAVAATGSGEVGMRRTSWWIVLACVALAGLVIWLGGTWLFRQFIRMHGGE